MTVAIEDIKVGMLVQVNDGTSGVVKGAFLSPDGFCLRILQGGGIVQRNVPLKFVVGVGPAEAEDPNVTGTALKEQ